MKNVALVFPGQGAQKVGMGREFYERSPQAKAVLDQADQVCANGLLRVMFEGPEEQLTQTAYCQPAILAMSFASFKAFEASPKFQSYRIKFAAGLSLGEYSALCASGTLDFADTLRLVMNRGSLMEAATKLAPGAMAAVISTGDGSASGGGRWDKVLEICRQTGAEVANFNSHEQIVITGHAVRVQAAIEAIKTAGGHKVIPLAVSGAFHSSLMQTAADQFQGFLKDVAIHPTDIKVLANVNGLPQESAAVIRLNLAKQITASVQWVASIEYMMAQGITDFIEIGPGKVLKGLIRRISANAVVHNIEKSQDIDDFIMP